MLENIQFSRPIAFFDLETTGTSIKSDRIVEICIIKIYPDGKSEKILERINPEMPISKEASLVHGIYEKDVADKPSFREFAKRFSDVLLGADIAGYNIRNFDLPLLTKEFERVGMKSPFSSGTKILDPMRIFHKMEKRDLSAAYKLYCNKELNDAHSAEADIEATMAVLNAQILKYQLDNSVAALDDLCSYDDEKGCIDIACKFRRDEDGEAVFTFGSNKGKKIKDNPGMLKWMLDKDFSEDTKEHAKKLLTELTKIEV
jgi:DNA polymerase III subunit epsilon